MAGLSFEVRFAVSRMRRSRLLAMFLFIMSFLSLSSGTTPSGAADNICDFTKVFSQNNINRNNELFPVRECVDNHPLTDGSTVKVCVETIVQSEIKESTYITVNGTTVVELPWQRIGSQFNLTADPECAKACSDSCSKLCDANSCFMDCYAKNPTNIMLCYSCFSKDFSTCPADCVTSCALDPKCAYSNLTIPEDHSYKVAVINDFRTEPQLCGHYKDPVNNDQFCADMKTDATSQCNTVSFNGNPIITDSCQCVKYNGFKIETLRRDSSDVCVKTVDDDDIQIHYVAYSPFGIIFDNSYINNIPVDVELGSVHFMRGWDHGLQGMCEGDVRKLTIPEYYYGHDSISWLKLTYPKGSPHPYVEDSDILTFVVELVKIGASERADLKEFPEEL